MNELENKVRQMLEILFIFPVNDPFQVWAYTVIGRSPVNAGAAALVMQVRALLDELEPPDFAAIRARLTEIEALNQQLRDLDDLPILDYVGAEADRADERRRLRLKQRQLFSHYAADVRQLLDRKGKVSEESNE